MGMASGFRINLISFFRAELLDLGFRVFQLSLEKHGRKERRKLKF